MKKLLGLFAFIWGMFSTLFICFFCLLDGKLELKAKPLWVVGIFLVLGVIAAMAGMELAIPSVKKKRSDKR